MFVRFGVLVVVNGVKVYEGVKVIVAVGLNVGVLVPVLV